MLTSAENELLCRVEGDSPMGRLMRRHWVPAILSEQLQPDGRPIRVQLFGEKLVAFRNSDGEVGILGEFCPHRKASLAFGRNEECGLRCLYHGWKFDTDGSVLDMPSEPKESALREKAKHLSYPTREVGGFVWTYMGPADLMPDFERPSWAPQENTRVAIAKIELPCNWAQIMEGQIDSAHSSSLHSSDMRPAKGEATAKDDHWVRPSTDKNPRIQVQLTGYGMRYAAIRRPITNSNTHDYVRITTYVAPFTALIPPNSSYNVASVIVPRNDTSSYFHFIAWANEDKLGIETDAWRKFCVLVLGDDVDANFRPIKRNAGNDYLQDRDLMETGHFTGIPGIPNQDIAMWESMGSIADRTQERLGASDIAIVQFRRLMLEAVQEFEKSQQVIGQVEPKLPQAKLCSYQGVVEKTLPWRMLGASDEEVAVLQGLEEDETEKEMAGAAA
ncbi:Rieske 2Fe-2S domain-containing protein [Pseudorhodoplanes sinuspersici]|uniref:MarR family transcriptional regulator n=1 Tax=Pseudorhodoplanes sinuspersici TaxID=1235591 RepID=A0A1W6ZL01_9HYPH|nr:Rieske 2Fe-2S domain-containing protein [Pseudorhodoplanes sinuspersici]ARP98031.1 MarR family transcriptional regulator [Pseudorhodoplanes sinuspersici]RKE68211.1 phthalate 4,5-dioxygenase oxygenase subunit [Pseudorhodoplanes sinuspersici]